jgi:hypothetical protein
MKVYDPQTPIVTNLKMASAGGAGSRLMGRGKEFRLGSSSSPSRKNLAIQKDSRMRKSTGDIQGFFDSRNTH